MQAKRAWYAITLFCVLCIAVILALWYQEVNFYRPNPEQLTTQAEVDQALKGDPTATPSRLLIPTGLFVLSFDFVKANEANVTGYVWQRHRIDQLAPDDDKSSPGKTRAGVLFPEQVGSTNTQLQEQYRREQLNAAGERELVIGWYFDVTVRQTFNYAKYPLDRHDVWLRMWPKDFDRDVVLVPDLASYDKTGRRDQFGYDHDIVPGAWKIEDTFFSFKRKCYDTNFGIQRYQGQTNFPELHFNLTLARLFENAFVVALVPLLSVLVLLFAVLVMSTGDEAKASKLGFSASGAIGASSGLLFVVMLAHVSLRKEFSTTGLVYLEYFYLISYFAVLAVSVNIYLFAAGLRSRWLDRLHRDDNLIPKLAFWPLVLLLLAIVTVAVFGPAAVKGRTGTDETVSAPRLCAPTAVKNTRVER